MHKLDTNEVAALGGDIIDKVADQHSTTPEELLAQMVLRTVSNSGTVFVDDKKDPTKLVYLLLGTYGMMGEAACIIMAAESMDDDTGFLFMAAKQYAKEFACKNIVVGDFIGDHAQDIAEKMKSPKTITIYVQET